MILARVLCKIFLARPLTRTYELHSHDPLTDRWIPHPGHTGFLRLLYPPVIVRSACMSSTHFGGAHFSDPNPGTPRSRRMAVSTGGLIVTST